MRSLWISFCFLAFTSPVWSCSCVNFDISDRESTARSLREAFAVFEGIVESREPDVEESTAEGGEESAYYGWRITLRTQRVYKGPNQSTIVVHTGSGGGDCGYPMDAYRAYLVYAYGDSTEDLGISICSRTAPLEQAGADLRYLRGEPPTDDDLLAPSEAQRVKANPGLKSSGATLCGRVRRPDNASLAEYSHVFLWPLTKVGHPDHERVFRRMLDAEGNFTFRMLEPGRYLLGASEYVPWDESSPVRYQVLYPGTQSFANAAKIELQARSIHCPVDLLLEPQPLYTLVIQIRLANGEVPPADWGIKFELRSVEDVMFPVQLGGYHLGDGIV